MIVTMFGHIVWMPLLTDLNERYLRVGELQLRAKCLDLVGANNGSIQYERICSGIENRNFPNFCDLHFVLCVGGKERNDSQGGAQYQKRQSVSFVSLSLFLLSLSLSVSLVSLSLSLSRRHSRRESALHLRAQPRVLATRAPIHLGERLGLEPQLQQIQVRVPRALHGGHRDRRFVDGLRRRGGNGEARACGDGARVRGRVEMRVEIRHGGVCALLKEAVRAERERVHEEETLPEQLECVCEHATIERTGGLSRVLLIKIHKIFE
jgi:hypothetical protein